MNFHELKSIRCAVHVRKEDYERFAILCDEYGFCDLNGVSLSLQMPRRSQQSRGNSEICFAHGYEGRSLDCHLSAGHLSTYRIHCFPVVEFSSFDEYDENNENAEWLPTQIPASVLMSIYE